jgi:hypothetical protein
MTTRSAVAPALALILGSLLLSLAAPVRSQTPPAATALFNGRDLTGWRSVGPGVWRVERSELVHEANTSHAQASLQTEREYGDVEVRFEYKRSKGASAVIGLRKDAIHSFGGPEDSWVTVRAIQIGDRSSIYVGEKLTRDHVRPQTADRLTSPLPARAPLTLAAAGTVRLRSVSVREIGSDEANAFLRARGAEGFVPVFNGTTFDGWAGPIDNYQIVDGALFCKPGSGGTIYTKNEYRDFAVRLDIQLPPGGNNGLAIRYPGKGDTAYVGMTELQVLDNTAEKYATLDPRQFHGSAYGMVPAHKGYQRPVGEWNFQEVTVRGSTIVVELNGARILDADLSTVKTFMADSPHPGKDRVAGHFGFAGHGDPVRFRNVQIKPLP